MGYNSVASADWASESWNFNGGSDSLTISIDASDVADADSLQIQTWWLDKNASVTVTGYYYEEEDPSEEAPDGALLTKTGNDSERESYAIDFSGLSEDEVASITKIVADVTVDSGYCSGTIRGYVDGFDSMMPWYGEVNGSSGQFVWELEGSLVAYDEDGNFAPYVEVQLWAISSIFDEHGNKTDGTATLTAVTLYDTDGNVVSSIVGGGSDAEEDPSEEDPSEEQPSEEQPSEEQPSGEDPSEEQPSEEQPSEEQPSGEDPSEEQPSGEQPSEEQPSEEQPSEADPSNNDDPSAPSTSSTSNPDGDAAPVAGLAVAVVAAFGAAAVCLKKKENA